MSLRDILAQCLVLEVADAHDVLIAQIASDSRKVAEGTAFVAIKGVSSDGHDFIEKAVALGASAIICEVMPSLVHRGVTYIRVADSHECLGQMASNFFGRPSTKMKVVGVTGTNGKTTVATLLYELYRSLGYSTGLLSTVQNKINDEVIPSTHTTPDHISLNALMARMVDAGCTHCFMEASSHAIHQRRIAGIDYTGAIFTNITHDHLDYHGTFDNYIKAKKLLFDTLPAKAFALVNIDDKRGVVMLQNCKARHRHFSLRTLADYHGKLVANTIQGLEMQIAGREVWFKLIGDFNASNLLAVYGAGIELGESAEDVLMALSNLEPVEGRFQRVFSHDGKTAIIDYAHTPDALTNVLETIKSLRLGNETVITVVGCGGNRDKDKRPVMAAEACKYSDSVILTSDNPRDEQPDVILQEMYAGVGITMRKKVQIIEDRRNAIAKACAMAKAGDIILVAGKGHEDYQEIKGVKYPFSDKTEVQKAFGLA